jgi:hypothetical protein
MVAISSPMKLSSAATNMPNKAMQPAGSKRPAADGHRHWPDRMSIPIHASKFYHDGRGPELQRVHWAHSGSVLAAIDYLNPHASGSQDLHHVRFSGVQVFMVTPEEVINYSVFGLGDSLIAHRPAAMFDLGQSAWLQSFAAQHLGRCRHLQLVFYDELFDVVCEDATCHAGGFEG